MKQFMKGISWVLVLCMMLAMAACGPKDPSKPSDSGSSVDPNKPGMEYQDPYAKYAGKYDELSAALYKDVLGDFYEAYQAAKEAKSVSERYALMAIAEAKLMETGVMLPLFSHGGNFAISRMAPNTVGYAMWGNDSKRFHQALICTEPILGEHRAEMKAKWAELKSTGKYEAWAKQYLKDHGYVLKDSYSMGYASDPQIWDVLATSRAVDSEAILNTYDGLYEYDNEGVLRPALAESYTISEDGCTYTFKIKSGIKWVDSQGREVAKVKADDFVAGFQHMLDARAGLEFLVKGVIVNAEEYMEGEVSFSEVGVEAPDDNTLVYTLAEPTSYFVTMLGYGIFAPMSREFYISQGGAFGADYDNSLESYTYGKAPENIAYCGPYLVTNATPENTIVFKANTSYWNAENINLKSITWLFNDGKEPTKAIKDTISGTLDGCGLTQAAVEYAKSVKIGDSNWFEKFGYISACDATTFPGFYNINRIAMENEADQAVKSSKTELDVLRSNAALRNASFRRAVSFAIDRGAYNAQKVGEDLKYVALSNSYTPGTFVSLTEEVTVDINGTPTTFKAGTFYGEIMQAQMDADGVKIMVWDPKADYGAGASTGYDGWYNPDNAVAELNKAIEELAAIGIEVSAENPIYIDLPHFPGSEANANMANALKQSVEKVLGGKVIITLTVANTQKELNNAGYTTEHGNEANYDLYTTSGWGPDYGDPQTFLDTFLPDYMGFMVKCIGIF